jgi:hypothetical protein
LYKKANWENIKEDLKSIQNTVNTMKEMNHPINSIWDHLKLALRKALNAMYQYKPLGGKKMDVHG